MRQTKTASDQDQVCQTQTATGYKLGGFFDGATDPCLWRGGYQFLGKNQTRAAGDEHGTVSSRSNPLASDPIPPLRFPIDEAQDGHTTKPLLRQTWRIILCLRHQTVNDFMQLHLPKIDKVTKTDTQICW